MWRVAFRLQRAFSSAKSVPPISPSPASSIGRKNHDIISISGRVLLLDEKRQFLGLKSLTDILGSIDQRSSNLIQVGETKYKVDNVQLEHVPKTLT